MLERAIADGYFVIGIFSVGKIQRNNGESVDKFIKVFNLRIGRDVLLDPKNRDKFIIILRKESAQQIEILTSDFQCINKAKRQLAFQNETIGISITVHCVASGGSSEPDQVPHIDSIIRQLDGFLDWNFKQIDTTKFEVSKKLSSTNKENAKQELNKLRLLLNYIAITRKIGIRVERYSIQEIPRFGPSHGIWGPLEWMVPPLSKEEIKRFEKFLSASPQIHKIADGLNQVYLLTSPDLRLAVLWAITEAVFADTPVPLLSHDEIENILNFATELPTLKGSERLSKLKNALSDPNRLPLKSRNRIISENIAKNLNLNAEDVYREIKKISKVRGKYLHRFKVKIKEVQEAEEYLRTLLEKYLKKLME